MAFVSRSVKESKPDPSALPGFGWSPRYMCNAKVRALAVGAALARAELTGKK